jgi:hypothetical protein
MPTLGGRALAALASAALASAALATGLPARADAATLYDFAWSGNSFSAMGSLVLAESVGVGDSFTTSDVLEFDLDLFDGSAAVASLQFPPFEGFDTITGTRHESTLSITDLVVGESGGLFGCTAGDCLSGEVFFDTAATPGASVDFGSTEAARASFVFTEIPEPAGSLPIAAALLALGALRARATAAGGASSTARPA